MKAMLTLVSVEALVPAILISSERRHSRSFEAQDTKGCPR